MSRSTSDDSVFQAVACPTRRALLDALARGESNVSDLVALLDVTQSAVSQQLATLKSAGLVAERAEGRFRYYRLRVQPLAEIEQQLDALGHVLDAMPDERPDQARGSKKRRRSLLPPAPRPRKRR